MKKDYAKRTFITVLVMIMCSLLSTTAFARSIEENGGVNNSGDLWQQLYSLPPFKFKIHKEGIGYGSCPVYTAPSEDAYRCAGGNATCQTNAKMDDAGFVAGWLLVRYETNNGGVRVGYIPPKYVRGFKSSMYPHFGFIPATADNTIYVTDNPMSHTGAFAVLDPGVDFYILSKYDYYKKNGLEWWYIQCVVDGKVACGFIDCGTSSFHLGY